VSGLSENQLPAMLALAALLAAIVAGGWWWRLRRSRRTLEYRLQKACHSAMHRFLLPDGNGDDIQFDYALLTAQGIVIVDVRNIAGNVFGSEGMQEWTALSNDRRQTFANPQPGLWDRMAAVKRIIPEVPVSGWIAFGPRARFTKGRPRSVLLLPELVEQLEADLRSGRPDQMLAFAPYWQRLRAASRAISA
jgi:hypothetical protein